MVAYEVQVFQGYMFLNVIVIFIYIYPYVNALCKSQIQKDSVVLQHFTFYKHEFYVLVDIWQKLHIKLYVVDLQRGKKPHTGNTMLTCSGLQVLQLSFSPTLRPRGEEAFRIL